MGWSTASSRLFEDFPLLQWSNHLVMNSVDLNCQEIIFLLTQRLLIPESERNQMFSWVQLPVVDVQDGASPPAAPHLDMLDHLQYIQEFSSVQQKNLTSKSESFLICSFRLSKFLQLRTSRASLLDELLLHRYSFVSISGRRNKKVQFSWISWRNN